MKTKNIAKPIVIAVATVAILLIVLGIVNACQRVPAGTAYAYESRQSYGHYIEQFTCNLGGNYEYKYYISGELRAASTGKYTVDGNEITFFNVKFSGSSYTINKTYKIVGNTLAEKYISGGSWITKTLICIGSIMLLVVCCVYLFYRHKTRNIKNNPEE